MKTKNQKPNEGHSKLGASSANRWFECPGSVRLSENVKKTENFFAIEGTAAHLLMAKVLLETPNANYYIGKTNKIKDWPKEVVLDVVMADHVQEFCDWVKAKKLELGAEMLVEHKFHLKNIHPDLWGTADVILYTEFGELHVIDFKYGAGVEVEVLDNEQLMYYGRGALDIGDFAKVVIWVAQPRFENAEEKTRSAHYRIKDIVEFGKVLRQKAMATEDPNAPLKEGEWCRWCPAAPICPQLHKQAVLVAQNDFSDPTLPEVKGLTDAQIEGVVRYGKIVQKWIDNVRNYARARVAAGEKIPNLKLVKGRGSRVWNNVSQVEKTLGGKYGERIYSRELLSVAKAEELFGPSAVKDLFSTVAGNATIAHETDKRKALPSAQDDFDAIEFGTGEEATLEDF